MYAPGERVGGLTMGFRRYRPVVNVLGREFLWEFITDGNAKEEECRFIAH